MGKFKEMDLLRQEREQALDKMAENARELGLNYDTPLSAFVRSSDEDKAEVMERVIDKAIEAQKKAQPAPVQEPVESPDDWSDWKVTPPAQPAPWVGLTDEEVAAAWPCELGSMEKRFARTIEAKLKEKNRG
jgi:hypothetical protein